MTYPRVLIYKTKEEYEKADKVYVQYAHLVAYGVPGRKFFLAKNRGGQNIEIHETSLHWYIQNAAHDLEISGG